MSRPGNHDVSADGKSNNNKHSESDWDAMKKCNFRLWTERKQYRDKADVIHNNFCQFINDTKEITDRRFSQLISEISDLGESSAQTKYICNLVIDLVREKAGGLKCEVSSRADEFTCWDADERTKTGWQDMNGENRKQSEPDQDRELADSEVESHKHDHGDELETTEGHEASDQYEASDEHETSEHRNPGDENDNYEHEHGERRIRVRQASVKDEFLHIETTFGHQITSRRVPCFLVVHHALQTLLVHVHEEVVSGCGLPNVCKVTTPVLWQSTDTIPVLYPLVGFHLRLELASRVQDTGAIQYLGILNDSLYHLVVNRKDSYALIFKAIISLLLSRARNLSYFS
ncbi:hypothetical protein GE09DRAFT_1240186 [Coniochaeta sp. 2T2.1]|nr:hypothetical protein GE09DRAFT_1240186 [Coniochaeta sp. 2T2.1]